MIGRNVNYHFHNPSIRLSFAHGGNEDKRRLAAMLWRIVRKIARIYSLGAIGLLLVMIAGDYLISPEHSEEEAMLSMFLPWGVLGGLAISWLFMALGAFITLMATGGFYLLSIGQNGVAPSSPWPIFVAGPSILFLIAAMLKALARKMRKS
jgi:hypothetical protein